MILIANSPFCDKPGAGRVTKTLLYALPLRGQQAVIPAGSADPTYVQARGARPNTIFFPDYVALTIPFSSALVGRRPMTTYVTLDIRPPGLKLSRKPPWVSRARRVHN